MKPGDLIKWTPKDGLGVDHIWKIKGVHLGAVGVESVVEIENWSHKPAWTGKWETHVMMFVPECLLRECEVIDSTP